MPFTKSIGFSEQICFSLDLVWTNHPLFGKTLLNKSEVYITFANAKCIQFHLAACRYVDVDVNTKTKCEARLMKEIFLNLNANSSAGHLMQFQQ